MTSIHEESPNTSSMTALKEKHTATLKNIKQLQETEKYLFESLPNLKNKGQDAIRQTISQINNISSIRKNLFEQLQTVYRNQNKTTGSSPDDDMTALLKVGEDNLNDTKAQLQSSQGDIFNTLRMIEIGKYEYERYNAHKVIMQIIAFSAITLYLLHILSKQMWIPIPHQIFQIIMLFVVIVGCILLINSQKQSQHFAAVERGDDVCCQNEFGTFR